MKKCRLVLLFCFSLANNITYSQECESTPSRAFVLKQTISPCYNGNDMADRLIMTESVLRSLCNDFTMFPPISDNYYWLVFDALNTYKQELEEEKRLAAELSDIARVASRANSNMDAFLKVMIDELNSKKMSAVSRGVRNERAYYEKSIKALTIMQNLFTNVVIGMETVDAFIALLTKVNKKLNTYENAGDAIGNILHTGKSLNPEMVQALRDIRDNLEKPESSVEINYRNCKTELWNLIEPLGSQATEPVINRIISILWKGKLKPIINEWHKIELINTIKCELFANAGIDVKSGIESARGALNATVFDTQVEHIVFDDLRSMYNDSRLPEEQYINSIKFILLVESENLRRIQQLFITVKSREKDIQLTERCSKYCLGIARSLR
jgi:hypothetical protein